MLDNAESYSTNTPKNRNWNYYKEIFQKDRDHSLQRQIGLLEIQ